MAVLKVFFPNHFKSNDPELIKKIENEMDHILEERTDNILENIEQTPLYDFVESFYYGDIDTGELLSKVSAMIKMHITDTYDDIDIIKEHIHKISIHIKSLDKDKLFDLLRSCSQLELYSGYMLSSDSILSHSFGEIEYQYDDDDIKRISDTLEIDINTTKAHICVGYYPLNDYGICMVLDTELLIEKILNP